MSAPEHDVVDRRHGSERRKPDAKHEIAKRTAPPVPVVYEAIAREGEEELRRRPSGLFWSGLAAGLSMGFSLVAEGLLLAHLPEAVWRPAVAKFGYSFGFLIVILGRQQLFTENTLTVMLPLLRKRTGGVLWKVARLWGVVLAANLLGAGLMAFVLARSGVYEREVLDAFTLLSLEADHGFWTICLRGIFAGWLIALMVWLMPTAQQSRVAVIIIVTYVIALGSLAHVIAGSVDKMFLVWTGHMTVAQFVFGWLAPALLGNVIGGTSLVAALNHAAVAAGTESGADEHAAQVPVAQGAREGPRN